MGGLSVVLWVAPLFFFKMFETPSYLMNISRFEEAVHVVHSVAQYNGVKSTLTTEALESSWAEGGGSEKNQDIEGREPTRNQGPQAAVEKALERFNWSHVRALFETKEQAISTSLLIAIWGTFHSRTYISSDAYYLCQR
jgi:hypothetical protein